MSIEHLPFICQFSIESGMVVYLHGISQFTLLESYRQFITPECVCRGLS